MPHVSNFAGPTLLVFADDWGRHPSSSQHLISRLIDKYDVAWINTIGTRSPKLNLPTLVRGLEKLQQWIAGSANRTVVLPDRLRVVNPRMWPSFKTRFGRQLNLRLLSRQLNKLIDSLNPPVIAITTLPITADLVGRLNVTQWTYYCVDDFGEWPGLDRDTLHEMEADLVRRVDNIVAVSTTLQDRILAMGRASSLLTHGVDLQHWQNGSGGMPEEFSSRFRSVPQPWIVFWGVVDRRLDVDYLAALCADLEHGSVLLVGPDDNPPPELRRMQRIVQTGPIPYQWLPELARQSSVLIMPYADLPVTRAMQPLKLKEYLATEKPVVVRDLPACMDWNECLDLANTPQAFSQLVRQRLANGTTMPQQRARLRLADETWQAKALQFERTIFGGLSIPSKVTVV